MRFSELTADFDGPVNRLYARVDEIRSAGADIIDLVRGSPEDAGIAFPADLLDRALADSASDARAYRPDSLGQEGARRAIAAYTRNTPDSILLTPGTSISYWYVFRLLANAGEEILCPTPSYPLFDYIAQMAQVELKAYRLEESRGWRIDLDDMERQITERTRAIVLISPHNPTGMVADRGQLESLAGVARRHGLAIISDEVFREFTFESDPAPRPSETDAPLVFSLNGFSKMFALPGLKIGWISVSGDTVPVQTAMRTLAMITDTFLPANEVAQFAVPRLFDIGPAFLADYRSRIRSLRDAAIGILPPYVTPPAGGFYSVVPHQRGIDDEDLALQLVTEDRVLVHPGYFYDMPEGHLVLSFVGEADRVGRGLEQVRRRLQSAQAGQSRL